jgi:hypothetical protein
MPEARHEGASTKVATATTGGSNSTNAQGQTVHQDATAQMPQQDNRTQPQLLASSSMDDNTRETSEIICREIRKMRGGPGTAKSE